METVELLKSIPMFRELNHDELSHIGQVIIERRFDKKSVIFHEGESKEAVFFIKEGLVKTFKTDENGHEQIMSFLKRGEMFPHTGLFNNKSYPATSEALLHTALLAIPVKSFESLLLEVPSMAIKIMRVMSDKIQELQGKLQELTGQDVHDRGQSFILKMAEYYGTVKGDEIHIPFPMTHQDIANVIGTTRETVTRLLNQLRKESILDADRQGFVIYSLEGLRNWKKR
ncbi:CRP/FNR family transcriptional regulator [Paenibacillus phyllosphaerae]|uniref:CRP/FNR family transcriptional regulator n=1 Tax=Paenibacillus phyllosphaerae TaxID=274593 RepID=A0A7W5FNH9_9BACL|nr:Crp/Fnr family transcriptional regulator [Paenibacillus phyllosphaerae]MBB3111162.1 CRP/FNR family transcriptional regulator [Paenibacillus phyllosphaerae]